MEIFLYEKIINYILEQIQKGKLTKGSKIPTESELMEQFQVSRITAKKALDDLADKKIIVRKRRLGSFVSTDYDFGNPIISDNDQNNKLISSHNNLIGIVFPIDTAKGDMMYYIQGILEVVTAKGYYMVISNAGRSPENERKLLEKYITDQVKGIIYYPYSDHANYDLMIQLSVQNYPIVTVDKYFTGVDISHVVSDNFTGELSIVNYLIENGHEKIAFFSDVTIDDKSSVRDRFKGYCSALASNNIPIRQDFIYTNIAKNFDVETDGIYLIVKSVSEAIERGITAIACSSDGVALLVMEACQSLGISIPERLSITGFDDLSDTQKLGIDLTTVHQNLYAMGKESANILIKLIENKKGGKHNMIFPVSLIKRNSVKNISRKS